MPGVELGGDAGVDRDQSTKRLRGSGHLAGEKPHLDPTPKQRKGAVELGRGPGNSTRSS